MHMLFGHVRLFILLVILGLNTGQTLANNEDENRAPATYSFPQGVAAGEPSSTSIVLWTRALPSKANVKEALVTVEIATDEDFSDIVITQEVTIHKGITQNYRKCPGDYIAKIQVDDLDPFTDYFYRFIAPDGTISDTGTFKTLQSPDSTDKVKFVVLSCGNYPPFTVLDTVVDIEPDVQFFSFNGDNVYADLNAPALPPPPPPYGVNINNVPNPDLFEPTPQQIEFYRNLYRIQRAGLPVQPQFRNLLENLAGFENWDDHEVLNDWNGRKDAGLPAVANSNTTPFRIIESLDKAGKRAFFEYNTLPVEFVPSDGITNQDIDVCNREFRRVRINKHVELFILDERQYRDAQAANLGDPFVPVLPALHGLTDPDGETISRDQLDALAANPVGYLPISAVLNPIKNDPSGSYNQFFGPSFYIEKLRSADVTMLGHVQLEWLKKSLLESDATFKFIINEVAFGNMYVLSYDQWFGYFKERQEILTFIEENELKNVVFLTGDQHAGVINQVNAVQGSPFPIYEVITGPVGQETFAVDLAAFDPSLPLVYFAFMNAFRGASSAGCPAPGCCAQPPILPMTDPNFPDGFDGSERSLLFLEINEPNYMTVEVEEVGSNIQATITLKNAAGAQLIDLCGRPGQLVLTA